MNHRLFLLIILFMVALACGTSDALTPEPPTSFSTSQPEPEEAQSTATSTSIPTPSPTLTIDSSAPPPDPVLGNMWIRPSDNMVMLYVPAGTFLMGSDPESDPDAEDDEFPQHEVALDGFWIDRTEVTNEQYVMCVQEGSCDASRYPVSSGYSGDTQPIVGVSWFDAEDYCTWAGGQLPTEAQWEYAARGEGGRLYPWGNESPTCNLAQFGGCDLTIISVGGLSPSGDSWVGATDMAGIVWEWVQDWFDGSYYENSPGTNPTGPETGDLKMLRGGSWLTFAANMRSANRYGDNPSDSLNDIGFRCASPGL